ncbi:DUF1292 domain-containing protein [Schnuerera sp.]|uniref:DUF1292 domain-containing protein n=1 Tax=Schnuerera sp. TaxID=2794844 RepID=UPI002C80B2FB|nr:DUF1292 domain-containing protein [Schnuerera sp.]HSH36665.1 DUF1292 domain-containing protein [Schnuerera sp.]
MNKNHDENCNCDQGHCDCDHEMDVLYLTLDDDTELECNVIGIFEVDDYEYIALVPVDDDQVLLYRYEEYEDGVELTNIEEDEELDIVSEAFYTLYVEDLDDEFDDYEDYDDEFYDDDLDYEDEDEI